MNIRKLFTAGVIALIVVSSLPAITSNEAKEIALKDAQVKTSRAKTEKDKNFFEVKFSEDGKDYEYKINAATGAIVKREYEVRKIPAPAGREIDQLRAEAVAKDVAGVSVRDIRKISAKPDAKDGRAVFEVGIITDRSEFEIVVDRATGLVIEFEEEIKVQPQQGQPAQGGGKPGPR